MTSNAPPPSGPAAAPTLSTNTMPAPLKRKYDDIVTALSTAGQAQAKRRRRAPQCVPFPPAFPILISDSAVATTEERFISIGKYFMRAVHPFMDVSEPMLYGPEHHWSTPNTATPSNTVVIPAS